MSFYDNYLKRDKISKLGKFLVKKKNIFFLEKILKYSSKPKEEIKVLEIGPGRGYFAEECRKQGFKYEGIEANFKMYESLKKRDFKVYNAFVPPIKLKDKFDVVFMNQVLEHMENRKNALKLFEQCKNRLNSGGLLIISVPDITYFKEDFWGCDYTHSFPLSLYSLKQIFVDFDLKIKYSKVKTLFFTGFFLTRIFKILMTILYNLGLINLVFKKKSYKIKNMGNASCIVVGEKNE